MAVKKLLDVVVTPDQLSQFRTEIQLIRAIRPSPYIVLLLGVCTNPDNPICLIYEFMRHGSLKDYLKSYPSDPELLLKWAREIALGLIHIHSEQVVHRDLGSCPRDRY